MGSLSMPPYFGVNAHEVMLTSMEAVLHVIKGNQLIRVMSARPVNMQSLHHLQQSFPRSNFIRLYSPWSVRLISALPVARIPCF